MLWLPWLVEKWADYVFDLELLFEFSFSCVKRFEAFQNSSKIHFSLREVLFIKVFTYVKFRILMNRWCENKYILSSMPCKAEYMLLFLLTSYFCTTVCQKVSAVPKNKNLILPNHHKKSFPWPLYFIKK